MRLDKKKKKEKKNGGQRRIHVAFSLSILKLQGKVRLQKKWIIIYMKLLCFQHVFICC